MNQISLPQSHDDFDRMYAEIQAKFYAILFVLKNRAQNAQDYAAQEYRFVTAFRACRAVTQQLELLNSWLKDGH